MGCVLSGVTVPRFNLSHFYVLTFLSGVHTITGGQWSIFAGESYREWDKNIQVHRGDLLQQLWEGSWTSFRYETNQDRVSSPETCSGQAWGGDTGRGRLQDEGCEVPQEFFWETDPQICTDPGQQTSLRLNSKMEYNLCQIPRISIKMGEKEIKEKKKDLENEIAEREQKDQELEIKIKTLEKLINKKRAPRRLQQCEPGRKKLRLDPLGEIENEIKGQTRRNWGQKNTGEKTRTNKETRITTSSI